MKKGKKALLLVACALLLVAGSVLGTLAYLTSTDSVTNTFTVGKVAITLDETDVNTMGEKDGETRVKANEYHLLPGHEYIKDPTVHVAADSENSYIRMIVTVSNAKNLVEVFGNNYALATIFQGHDDTKWILKASEINEEADTFTYEYRYYTTVETVDKEAKDLEALFTSIKIPGTVDNAGLAKLEGTRIDVVAHAIQADGFQTEDAAWVAFATN